jgi:mono/diheme cytochrome c family protein
MQKVKRASCVGRTLGRLQEETMKPLACALATWCLMLAPAVYGQGEKPGEDTDLARRAHSILRTHCHACHGRDGKNEGGVNYVTDLKSLVARRKIVPREPAKSRLYRRIIDADDPMPPESEKVRPSREDIAALKRWIEAGAPDVESPLPQRAFISEDEIIQAIDDDLQKISERQRRFMRFITITHLYNAGLSDEQLQTYRHGLSKLLNSLSWARQIVVPQPIDAAKTVLRIDLRHYQWSAERWSALLAAYPYGVIYAAPRAKAVYQATGGELPYVRGDWFVFAASQPPLYHELLQLPDTDADLERVPRVETATNIRQEQVARAGFNSSGVSRNNRLIERHESPYGAYWKSYDFAGNAGRKNLFAHPLGPGNDDASFEHDGGELIFNLPNGLQGYLLTDARGKRLDRGPTAIVSDERQPDRAVVNGVSCMSCHAKGMISKTDQVREHVLKNSNAFDKETLETVRAIYPPKEAFDRLLKQDADRFARAVEKTGAHLSKTEPIAALALRFTQELDLPLAAAEAGLTVADFLKGLARSADLARQLGPLRTEGGTIQRDVFVAAFPQIVRQLHGGQYLESAGSPRADGLIAASGFNDAKGLLSDSTPNSPFAFGNNREGGRAELGWAHPWPAHPVASFQKKVVFEGDGALHLTGSQTVGPNYRRNFAQAQAEHFQVDHHVQVPAGSGFGGYLVRDGRGSHAGPNWSASDGKFLARDGDGGDGGPMLDTGFVCKPGVWYKVTLRVNVPDRTYEFLVDDKLFAPQRPLRFRVNIEYIDQINFLVGNQTGVYFDAVRITRLKAP